MSFANTQRETLSIPTYLLIENMSSTLRHKTNTHHVQIDDCVKDPGGREHPDEHDGGTSGGSRGQVEGTQNQERQHVLQVVQVGSPHPLHVRVVELHLSTRSGVRVFWVGEYLRSTEGGGGVGKNEYWTILGDKFEIDLSRHSDLGT